ncbi:Crp/Fnr family transcriptional regulator [Pseudodesulfovibrio portus]|uniref:Transcriptional regulator n=1 Tax=Pseudodesulfovibrio portus TaxID=231439 RepID=A0ABM8AVD6_9BACT|nr:Crp/Fnr family transcriptional regulator [Pseudodesulfovibrio portus]BDQ35338.1 transcriptional regulator [Pseudodesulfovibrio portus]
MKFSGINLLDELGKSELAELRAAFHERSFVKDHIIYTPEAEDDLVFVISKGRVRIYLAYGDKEFTLAILNPGDLYATHADCYIQAFDDTTLLLAGVKEVKTVMARVPLFTRTMVRVLGHILRNSFSIIGDLAFKDIRDRLLSYILVEADTHGTKLEDGGVELRFDLTIEQLSLLMGATRQTVSTLLNNLERDGLIKKTGRGRYCIPDMDELSRQADKNAA